MGRGSEQLIEDRFPAGLQKNIQGLQAASGFFLAAALVQDLAVAEKLIGDDQLDPVAVQRPGGNGPEKFHSLPGLLGHEPAHGSIDGGAGAFAEQQHAVLVVFIEQVQIDLLLLTQDM